MNFKRQVLLGSLWSLFGNSGQQLIGFCIFIYIARTVTPADVGLVALALVLIGVLAFVSRFGQVEALQRQAELSDRMINTSFWLLAGAGVLTTGAVFGAAQFAWLFSDEPDLPMVLMLLAPLCALQSWNAVPEAILRRRFDFRTLSLRNWLAALSGGGVGIYLAYHGFGVYALVAQRVVTALVQTVATWVALRWHPRFVFSLADMKQLSRTGGAVMTAGFSGTLNLRITDALTGTMVGVTALGFLRLGWRFFDVIVTVSVNPVTNVALTTFSRLQNDRPALRRAYLRLTQFMATGSLPMFFGLGAVADVLIPIVFGAKWLPSAVVLELLGLVILPGVVNFFFGPAMIAVGRTRVLLWQSTVQVMMTLVLVYAGAQFGIIGVMVAIIVRAVLVAIYNVHALSREGIADFAAVLRLLIPPAASCGVMVAAVEALKWQLAGSLMPILLLALLVVAGAAVYGAVLVAGDYLGLWRGYVRGASKSLLDALLRRDTGALKPA